MKPDLAEEEKVCACGARLSRIGQDVCEKLDYIPAKVRVLRHVRFNYACKACQGVEDLGPTVLYRYHPTRSGKVALAFLDEYHGYIQSDDYDGYNFLGQKESIIHMACWAHARRKFTEVVKVRKKIRGKRANAKTLADEALDYIGKLYLIEKQACGQEMTMEQIYSLRQEKAKPILDAFEKWLEKNQALTLPQGLLRIAINYALSNWSKLTVYIDDGRLKPDNNAAENVIRPFVLGRKNSLFARAPNGADAGAAFFSLIETAKANGLEPYFYLRCLFEQLPFIKDQNGFGLNDA